MPDDVVEEFLSHYGVPGMKWGQRRSRPAGVSRSTSRDAAKDAKEFARAKAFYGQGAGTRRKLIKQTVEGKAKRSPSYQKAFDHHLNNQDTSKHASKAVGERKRKDFKERNTKRAGFFARHLTGEQGTQAAFMAAGVAGVAFAASPKGQQLRKKAVSKYQNSVEGRIARQKAKNFLKKNGLL